MPSAAASSAASSKFMHVAGVVLDDVEDAGAAVDGAGGGDDLVRHGRGEDRAGAGGVEHARPDEAGVERLVAAAAAGDEADLAGDRRVAPHDDTAGRVDAQQVGMGEAQPLQRLPHDILGPVDQLLHRALPPRATGVGRRSPAANG